MLFYLIVTLFLSFFLVESRPALSGLKNKVNISGRTTTCSTISMQRKSEIQFWTDPCCIYNLRGGSTSDGNDSMIGESSLPSTVSRTCSANMNGSVDAKVQVKKKKKRRKNTTKSKKQKKVIITNDNVVVDGGSNNIHNEKSQSATTTKKREIKTTQISSEPNKKKVHKKQKLSSSSSKRENKKTKNAKSGECLRRIKHEWKTIVQLGIGYDWISQQTISSQNNSNSNRNPNQRNDHFYKYNYIRIGPLQNNLLHWHFSVQGPSNSVYQNGIYHGRIILPKTYPGHPPRIQILTPSGRFVTGEDICLSVSAFHPETWSPRWTILSLVDALRIHMLTTANEIGGLHKSDEMREKFAWSSRYWKWGCFDHGQMVQDGLFCPPPKVAQVVLKDNGSTSTCSDDDIVVEKESDQFEQMANEQKSIQGEEEHYPYVNNKEKSIDQTVAFIASTKVKEKQEEAQGKQSNHGIVSSSSSTSSKRKRRLERRPSKQNIIVLAVHGIIEFFQRHLEYGIIFVCLYFCFR